MSYNTFRCRTTPSDVVQQLPMPYNTFRRRTTSNRIDPIWVGRCRTYTEILGLEQVCWHRSGPAIILGEKHLVKNWLISTLDKVLYLVLRHRSECQRAECKRAERHRAEFKENVTVQKRHISELKKCRNVTVSI
jgi:hypothetical protein